MTDRQREPPLSVRLGAALLVCDQLGWFLAPPITLVSGASLVAMAFLAWAVVEGWRLAWFVSLFILVAQVAAPFTLHTPVGLSVAAAGAFFLLIAPSARDYIFGKPSLNLLSSSRGLTQLPFVSVPVAGKSNARELRPSRVLVLLGIWLFAVLPIVGTLGNLHNGSAHGSMPVSLLWRVCLICWVLALFGLIFLLLRALSSANDGQDARS